MRRCFLLVLCAAGILAAAAQPYNASIIDTEIEGSASLDRENESIRRYACPVGFFRLKRYCYYLSGGVAPWREAYFHCRDRNATLAILDRNGKDRMLRKYLSSDQFTKLERWIGGIFNWQQQTWLWGVTGDRVVFQNFGEPQNDQLKQQDAWYCLTIDPRFKYKWSPRSCMERRHYVCEVAAGRIARRRKKTADPFAPQNQRLKPRKRGKKYRKDERKPDGKKKRRPPWRKNVGDQNADNYWVHGVNLGSRPPSNVGGTYRMRMRHRANRTRTSYPRVAQMRARGGISGAFLRDGTGDGPRSLTDVSEIYSRASGGINDLASEEILLKL